MNRVQCEWTGTRSVCGGEARRDCDVPRPARGTGILSARTGPSLPWRAAPARPCLRSSSCPHRSTRHPTAPRRPSESSACPVAGPPAAAGERWGLRRPPALGRGLSLHAFRPPGPDRRRQAPWLIDAVRTAGGAPPGPERRRLARSHPRGAFMGVHGAWSMERAVCIGRRIEVVACATARAGAPRRKRGTPPPPPRRPIRQSPGRARVRRAPVRRCRFLDSRRSRHGGMAVPAHFPTACRAPCGWLPARRRPVEAGVRWRGL